MQTLNRLSNSYFNFKFTCFFFFLLCAYNQVYSFYIGPQFQHENYKEDFKKTLRSNEEKSNEKGTLYGFKGGIEYLNKSLYADAHLEYAKGTTNFNGTRYNYKTRALRPYKALTENDQLVLEGSLGYPFKIKNFKFIPFWGFGFNHWSRQLEDYLEIYRWVYFPFGAISEISFFSAWDIGIKAKAMPTALAEIEFRGVYPWPSKLMLENRWQYSLDLYTKVKVKKVNIWLGVFYRNLNMGESKKIRKSSFSTQSSKKEIFGEELLLEFGF